MVTGLEDEQVETLQYWGDDGDILWASWFSGWAVDHEERCVVRSEQDSSFDGRH